MIKNFKKYRPFFVFLLRFICVYILLVVLYKWYLNQFNTGPFEVDFITRFVTSVADSVIQYLGYHSEIESNLHESSMILLINDIPIVRVIEGCNGVSIILLFMAFVVAFSGPPKTTFIFALLGSIMVFILNIIRIILISIALYHLPLYENILHNILFPLIIYGIVFILWLIWINKYSYHAKEAA